MNDLVMQEMTDAEIALVSGGITENQCIGLFTLGGALVGAVGSGGNIGVAGYGAALGGALGMVTCARIVGK